MLREKPILYCLAGLLPEEVALEAVDEVFAPQPANTPRVNRATVAKDTHFLAIFRNVLLLLNFGVFESG